MSWKKIGGLNIKESKRGVSDYEGNLFDKLISNDLRVNNSQTIDESLGINYPTTQLLLNIPKHKQTILNIGGNYKQTGSTFEIFNQDSTNNNSATHKRALVHSDDDILKINPNFDYEKSVEIYSTTNYPLKLLGDLDVSGDNVDISSNKISFVGNTTTTRAIDYYYNFNNVNYQEGTFDVSNNFIDFEINGLLKVLNDVNIQNVDISASSLADLYIASEVLSISNRTRIINAIESDKTAFNHNSLDRLVVNPNEQYTGGVQIKGGKYNNNIFLDGNVQIGYCQQSETSSFQGLSDDGNIVTYRSFRGITNNNAYDKAFAAESDIPYNLDIAGNCRVRGDFLHVGGNFIVEGSRVVLNSSADWMTIEALTCQDNVVIGYNTIGYSNEFTADMTGGIINRSGLFIGNPYSILDRAPDFDNNPGDLNLQSNFSDFEVNDNEEFTRDYGGLYFANTVDNTIDTEGDITGPIFFANMQKNYFKYTGITKRLLTHNIPYGSELLLYNYKYPQNYSTNFGGQQSGTPYIHSGDRIRLFAGSIRFDTYNVKLEPDSVNNHFNDVAHTRMLIDSSGNIGIGDYFKDLNRTPDVKLAIESTDAIKIPKGTTSERPVLNEDPDDDDKHADVGHQGYVRYNTTLGIFEGFGKNNQWGTLGGVIDVDRDTYISAEEHCPGMDNDQLLFFTAGVQRMVIEPNGDARFENTFTIGNDLIVEDEVTIQNNLFVANDVGIGMDGVLNTPYGKLHVIQDVNWNNVINSSNNFLRGDANDGLNGTLLLTNKLANSALPNQIGACLTFSQLYLDTNPVEVAVGAITGIKLGANNSYGGGLTFWTHPSSNTASLERMRILDNGYIGIGTTTPESILHVVGDINALNPGLGLHLGMANNIDSTIEMVSSGPNAVIDFHTNVVSTSNDYTGRLIYNHNDGFKILTTNELINIKNTGDITFNRANLDFKRVNTNSSEITTTGDFILSTPNTGNSKFSFRDSTYGATGVDAVQIYNGTVGIGDAPETNYTLNVSGNTKISNNGDLVVARDVYIEGNLYTGSTPTTSYSNAHWYFSVLNNAFINAFVAIGNNNDFNNSNEPQAPLHIKYKNTENSNSGFEKIGLLIENTGGDNDDDAAIMLKSINQGESVVYFNHAGDNKWSLQSIDNHTTNAFSIYSNTSNTNYTKLYIKQGENSRFGFNTNSPLGDFHFKNGSTTCDFIIGPNNTSYTTSRTTTLKIGTPTDGDGDKGCAKIVSVSGNYDADLRFHTSTANNVTSAPERMRIAHNGYVGIGTNDPKSILHIFGDRDNSTQSEGIHIGRNGTVGDYDQAIEMVASGTNCYLDFKKTSGNSDFDGRFLYNVDDHYFQIYTNRTEKMRITSSGNVGIGTDDPQNKLDVEGSVVIGSSYSGTSAAPTNGLLVQGNVGIGLTNPAAPLEVYGGSIGGSSGATRDTLTLRVARGGGSGSAANDVGHGARLKFSHTSAGTASTSETRWVSIESVSESSFSNHIGLRFFTRTGTPTERMRISATGNVGIGTTSPQNKLDVEGAVAIGATYSGTNAAPSNGMIVQGNVGIGTTSPGAILDVVGNFQARNGSLFYSNNATHKTVLTHAVLSLRNDGVTATYQHGKPCLSMDWDTGTNAQWVIGQGGVTGVAGDTSTMGIGWAESGSYGWSPKFFFTKDGKLGIDVKSPNSNCKLEVNGSIRAGHNTNTASYFGKSAVGYNTNDSDQASFAHIDCNNGTKYALLQNSSGETILNSASTKRLRFRINDADKMTIDKDGNVGIGTTSPDSKLEVKGPIRANRSTNTASSFGRAAVGYCGHDNWASFAHISSNNQDDYALLQNSDGETILNSASGKRLRFRINNGDKMTLNSNGNVGIGTTSPEYKLHVSGEIKFNEFLIAAQSEMKFAIKNGTSTTTRMIINNNSVGIFNDNPDSAYKLDVNGNFRSTGNARATYFVATSDINLKENIKDIDNALLKISSIRGVTFNFKDDLNDQGGIIAQEVEKVIPEAIQKDKYDIYTANYNTLTAYLIESVKSLKEINDKQKDTISSLEERLEKNEKLINMLLEKTGLHKD